MNEAPTTLYVAEQGAHVHRVSGRVVVRGARGIVLQDVPLFRLERIVLLGNVEVTRSAFVVYLEILGIVAEGLLMLWLLVLGVNGRRWAQLAGQP